MYIRFGCWFVEKGGIVMLTSLWLLWCLCLCAFFFDFLFPGFCRGVLVFGCGVFVYFGDGLLFGCLWFLFSACYCKNKLILLVLKRKIW